MGVIVQRRIGQIDGVFIVLGINQLVLNSSIRASWPELATALSVLVWLGLAASLSLGIGLIVRLAMIRRHIDAFRVREVPWDTLPMNNDERRWDGELRWLGFRPLGCLQAETPHGQPGISWKYADADGRIAGEIHRLTGSANFWTVFLDDFEASTRNRNLMPKMSIPHYEAVNVDSPGHALGPAYQAHVARLHQLAPVHGDAVHLMTIGDVLAAEERSVALLMPELRREGRSREFFAVLVLVLAPAALMVALGLQLLAS